MAATSQRLAENAVASEVEDEKFTPRSSRFLMVKGKRLNEADTFMALPPKKKARYKISEQSAKPSNAIATDEEIPSSKQLKPYPFFYYRDCSQEEDSDPLTPLTQVGRVPNLPAKMHAILSREDLSDVVSWSPHGRGWIIHNQRNFEKKVLPVYFKHSRLSSFIRQANGWGFRRITQGIDKNCYFHELFLRGMPYLCKGMRRPGVSGKTQLHPHHEPDLYEISKLHPLPESDASQDESILWNFSLKGGPEARVPLLAISDSEGEGMDLTQSVEHGTSETATSKTGSELIENELFPTSLTQERPPSSPSSMQGSPPSTSPLSEGTATSASPLMDGLTSPVTQGPASVPASLTQGLGPSYHSGQQLETGKTASLIHKKCEDLSAAAQALSKVNTSPPSMLFHRGPVPDAFPVMSLLQTCLQQNATNIEIAAAIKAQIDPFVPMLTMFSNFLKGCGQVTTTPVTHGYTPALPTNHLVNGQQVLTDAYNLFFASQGVSPPWNPPM